MNASTSNRSIAALPALAAAIGTAWAATPGDADADVESVADAKAEKADIAANLQKQAWCTRKAIPKVKACRSAAQ